MKAYGNREALRWLASLWEFNLRRRRSAAAPVMLYFSPEWRVMVTQAGSAEPGISLRLLPRTSNAGPVGPHSVMDWIALADMVLLSLEMGASCPAQSGPSGPKIIVRLCSARATLV